MARDLRLAHVERDWLMTICLILQAPECDCTLDDCVCLREKGAEPAHEGPVLSSGLLQGHHSQVQRLVRHKQPVDRTVALVPLRLHDRDAFQVKRGSSKDRLPVLVIKPKQLALLLVISEFREREGEFIC